MREQKGTNNGGWWLKQKTAEIKNVKTNIEKTDVGCQKLATQQMEDKALGLLNLWKEIHNVYANAFQKHANKGEFSASPKCNAFFKQNSPKTQNLQTTKNWIVNSTFNAFQTAANGAQSRSSKYYQKAALAQKAG